MLSLFRSKVSFYFGVDFLCLICLIRMFLEWFRRRFWLEIWREFVEGGLGSKIRIFIFGEEV